MCRYSELVRSHKAELEGSGVTTLPGLVTRLALHTAVQEVERKAEQSYTMQTSHNIYLTDRDEGDHVSTRRLDTKVRLGELLSTDWNTLYMSFLKVYKKEVKFKTRVQLK